MSKPDDTIDDKIWHIVVEWCDASSRGDGVTFRRWEDALGDYGNAAAPAVQYIAYILDYLVLQRVGHRPSEVEIHELATALDPKYRRIVGGPSITIEQRVERLEGTIRRLYDYPYPDAVDGIVWLIDAVAVIGTLLIAARPQLAEFRPTLSTWITTYAPRLAGWDVDHPDLDERP